MFIAAANASNNDQPTLQIKKIKYTSSFNYWYLKATDFVSGHTGDLKIKIKNIGDKPSPKAELSAEMIYTFPRTHSSPVIYPSSYLKERLRLGQKEMTAINPNDTLTLNINTETIKFNKPGVEKSVTLWIVIRNLSESRNIIYEDYIDYNYLTESEAVEAHRGKLSFLISIITLIIVFITFIISLPEKRPYFSFVLIIALLIIAYLIYRSN
jgi:hypothetical protein